MKTCLYLAFCTILTFSMVAGGQSAQEILEATGVKGGLVVHLDCGTGELTAALRVNRGTIVHGLARTEAQVAQARATVTSLGLYGPVSIDLLAGTDLPYIDNSVNLIVAKDLGTIPMAEVERILCPLGVAYIKQQGTWQKTVKPRPAAIDEWTHYLHDATNNAVAHDDVVGPPRRLQWTGGPRWSRHHDHMSSISAVVSAGGRVFHIIDEGSKWSILTPSDWKLTGRDAFNGTVLWKRDITSWQTQLYRLKSGPSSLPRRLVAHGDRVYVTLALEAPLTALDAATGETVRTYHNTQSTEEILYDRGKLLLLVNDGPVLAAGTNTLPTSAFGFRNNAAIPYDEELPRRLMMVQADTGDVLWQWPGKVLPLTMAMNDKSVFFHDGERIRCLDRKDGEPLWESQPLSRRDPIITYFAPTLVVYENVVLFAGGAVAPSKETTEGDVMVALDVETGQLLWQGDHPPCGYRSPEDVLVSNGQVWAGETTFGSYYGLFTGRDPQTGAITNQFGPDVDTHWFHHRCYRGKATNKYLLMSRTGIEFLDPKTQHWECHHWVRGACLYGVMPCNGLVYAPPTDCGCYILAKLYGFNALAPAPQKIEYRGRRAVDRRREIGPAFGSLATDHSSLAPDLDWPTFRHDAGRSGFTSSRVPLKLSLIWQTALGGELSTVVVAEGKLLVAAKHEHTIHALDEQTGRKLWSTTVGGRVDSPPTVYQGRVLFGCADGWVYCLRAEDGELAWRYRAAPEDRRLVAYDQVESVWPLHGSVLIQNDTLYTVAGRSMFLDGGLRLLRLNPLTGELLSETVMDDRDPNSGENLQALLSGLNMPTALPDVLSSDGSYVYMRAQHFDMQGRRLELITPKNAQDQMGATAHLFGSTGFLDGSWFHRAYWIYGKTFLSGAGGYYQAGNNAPAGRLLAFDKERVYGFGRKPQYFKWTTPMEFQLFATSKTDFQGSKPSTGPTNKPFVDIPKAASLDPTGKPLTVTAWVRATQKTGVILAHGGPSHGYALTLKNGKPWFNVRIDSTLYEVRSNLDIRNQWVHVTGVLTADGTKLLYLNGQVVGQTYTGKVLTSDPAQAMGIGGDSGGAVGDYTAPYAFTGKIDEVRVYHRALDAGEIQTMAGKPQQVEAVDTADLVLYYSFDEGKAIDLSGQENHGTVWGANAAVGKVGQALAFSGKNLTPPSNSIVQYQWSKQIPFFVRAMVLAQDKLVIAGPPDLMDEEAVYVDPNYSDRVPQVEEQDAAFAGAKGALLWVSAAEGGKKLAEYKLDVLPVWDGLIAANNRLYLALTDGSIICLGGE